MGPGGLVRGHSLAQVIATGVSGGFCRGFVGDGPGVSGGGFASCPSHLKCHCILSFMFSFNGPLHIFCSCFFYVFILYLVYYMVFDVRS